MTVYKWMRKLSFEHLNGRVIYVKTTNDFFFVVRILDKATQTCVFREMSYSVFGTICALKTESFHF